MPSHRKRCCQCIVIILCCNLYGVAARLDVVQGKALVILRDHVVNLVAAPNALTVNRIFAKLYGCQIFQKIAIRAVDGQGNGLRVLIDLFRQQRDFSSFTLP